MFKPRTLSMLIAATALAGCQAVNTTSGGAVGVDRKQYMFSMLSTDQVNQMYAQSYQETLSAAASKGMLEKNTAIAKRVNGIAERLIAKVGENVQVRRMARIDSDKTVGAYVHGGRIGVLVEVEGGDAELARGLAMHIAAMNPPYVSPAHVPADFVAREKEIALAQVKDTNKPADIIEKMISGKVAKTVNELCLTGQPYVMDTNQTVEQVLKSAKAEVKQFVRLAVGEGIEKQADDFASEVMKQAGLA